jgi:hypothetical protein
MASFDRIVPQIILIIFPSYNDRCLRTTYTFCQNFFLIPLTLTLSPRWGERGEEERTCGNRDILHVSLFSYPSLRGWGRGFGRGGRGHLRKSHWPPLPKITFPSASTPARPRFARPGPRSSAPGLASSGSAVGAGSGRRPWASLRIPAGRSLRSTSAGSR